MGLFTSPSLSDLFLSLSPLAPPSIPKDPKLANTRAQKKEMARRKKIGKREIEEGREPLFDVFACIQETKASNCK